MLDRLAQPQFWNAALTIATRQHAQLLQMHDTLEELETGTLATGPVEAEWRSKVRSRPPGACGVMAGGLKAGYLLLQQLRSWQAFPFDCQDYCGLVGALEPSVIRTGMWIPFCVAGQSFADFARRAHVSSHRWRSAVLATPPVLDADTAEIILPSVDAFQVQASGMTLQELHSKGTKTSRSVDDFLDAPSPSAFNALTNTVRTLRLH